MALDYQDLSDLFHEARAGSPELLGKVTLPQFAAELNRTSGTQDYSAGLSSNWIKETSASINRAINWTGLPEKSGEAFRGLAESLGVSPETGYNVGKGLPRAAVNFLPMLAAAPFTGGGSLLPAVAGVGGTAALSAAGTYEETGSPTQALITGATTAALPGISKLGGQLALKAIGTPLTKVAVGDLLGVASGVEQTGKAGFQLVEPTVARAAINERIAKTLGERVASYAGGQASAFGDFEAAHQIGSVFAGEGLQNPFDPNNVFATVAGQLPFMVADIPRVVRATPQMEVIQRAVDTAAKTKDAKVGLASVPDIAPSGESERKPDLVKFNDIIARKVKITQDDTLDADQKAQKLAELDKQETTVVENQSKQSIEDKANMLFDEPVKPLLLEDRFRPTRLKEVWDSPTLVNEQIDSLQKRVEQLTGDSYHAAIFNERKGQYSPEIASQIRPLMKREWLLNNRLEDFQHGWASNVDQMDEAITKVGDKAQFRRGLRKYIADAKLTDPSDIAHATNAFAQEVLSGSKLSKQYLGEVTNAPGTGESIETGGQQGTPTVEQGTEGSVRLRNDATGRVETQTRTAESVQPIVATAKANVLSPVVDLPTAVDKVKKASETNVELGSEPITNEKLGAKADALLSDGEELTPTVEKVTQAVASESVDRADVVQRVTQRTLKKQQGQADAMAYMAEREKTLDFPKDIIEGWLSRASSLSAGKIDNYTNDVAAVFRNWDSEGRPGGVDTLNARLSVALRNADKPLPLETRTLKNDGSVSSVKGGRGNQSRKLFDSPGDALDALNEAESKYLAAIPEKNRGQDTSAFAIRKVKGEEKYYVEQRVYPRAETLYEGHTPEVDRNALSQAQQDDINTHIEVTDAAPELISEAGELTASPQLKQAAEVTKASVNDFVAAIRFAPDDTIYEILGFGTKDNPTQPADVEQFRQRVATIVENVATGHNDPEFLNDRLKAKGIHFDTPNQLVEFMDGSSFATALGVARDLVHEQQHPTISLDAVGAQGEQVQVESQRLVAKPFGLLGGLSNLFTKWYQQLGMTDMMLEGHVQSTLRVAALFKQLDDGRVGELINNARDRNIYGISVSGFNTAAVWLAKLPDRFGATADQFRIAHKLILGHELWHSLEDMHKNGQLSSQDTRVMNRLVDHLENSSITERTQMLTEFYNELLPKWAQNEDLRSLILTGANDAAESRANLGSMLATSLTEFKPRTVRSLIEFMPKPIGDFISSAIKHFKTLVSSISGANIFNERGLIEPVTNEFTHPVLNEFTTGFLALTREIGKVEELTQRFMELQNFEPVGFRQLQKDYLLNPLQARTFTFLGDHKTELTDSIKAVGYMMSMGKEPKGLETELADKKSESSGLIKSFVRLVNPALQFAEANPLIRPAVWLPMEWLKQGHDFMRKSLLPFSGRWNADTGEIEFGAGLDHMRRLQKDSVARAALDKIQLWQNDEGRPFVKEDGRSFEDPTLVQNLSKQQLADVISANLAIRGSNEINQTTYLTSKRATLVQRMAQTISGQNPSWKPAQAKVIAETMVAATEMLGDQTKLPQAQATFSQLQTKLSAEQFIPLQQFAQEGLGAIGKLKEFYDKNPQFTSERRYGGYAIQYLKQDGTTGRVSGRTEKEVNDRLGQVSNVKQVLDRITPESVVQTEGLNRSFIETAQKFEDVVKSRMQQMLGEVEFDKIKDISFTDPLVRELAARQLGEVQPTRRGASGRETLDMLENHLHYTNALTRHMGTTYIKNELALQLRDPELAGRDDLKNYARQHVANFLAPDSPAGRALVNTNFLYYMGMNISTTMMESVQSFFSLVPGLIREGGGILSTYNNVLGSAKEIGQWALTKKWANPEHEQLMERAGREHNIQLGSFSELLDPEEHGAVNISRLMLRQDPATMGDLITKPVGQFSQLARSYYSIFTNFNHRIALLSAFDHFRSQGLDFEQAYENANRVNHVVNFSGGRAARPVGWFQPADPIGRTAAQGLYSLMSYQFGMISMMGRYLREGFGPVDSSISPWQRSQARSAAVVMLGTQLVAAGALGLPAVGAGIAVLEQLFPNLELNKKIRENLASLGGQDQQLGAIISDMALHGVVNQVGGVDLGSRFALGNILGTSSYDGFSVENFLGPTGNLLKNMALGVQQASQGDLGRAAQSVMPQAFKRPIDLIRNDFVVRDQRGNSLLQPTLGEKFAMMIGFSPTRVTATRDAQRIMQRSQQIERNDIIRFHQDLADQVLQGDYPGARQALIDRAKSDRSYDPRVGAGEIAGAVANKTLPVDLRRMGSKSSAQDDAEILRTYALTGPPPSELQRLQIKQSVMSRLGLGAQITPSRFQEASLTDQLLSTDPALTRSGVRSRVSQLLHPSSRGSLPQLLVSPTSE